MLHQFLKNALYFLNNISDAPDGQVWNYLEKLNITFSIPTYYLNNITIRYATFKFYFSTTRTNISSYTMEYYFEADFRLFFLSQFGEMDDVKVS